MYREYDCHRTSRISHSTYSNLVRKEQQKLRQLDELVATVEKERGRKKSLQEEIDRLTTAVRRKKRRVDQLFCLYTDQQAAQLRQRRFRKPANAPKEHGDSTSPERAYPSDYSRDSSKHRSRHWSRNRSGRRSNPSPGVEIKLPSKPREERVKRQSSTNGLPDAGCPFSSTPLEPQPHRREDGAANSGFFSSTRVPGPSQTSLPGPPRSELPTREAGDTILKEPSQHHLSRSLHSNDPSCPWNANQSQSFRGSQPDPVQQAKEFQESVLQSVHQSMQHPSAISVADPEPKPSVWTRAQWYRTLALIWKIAQSIDSIASFR
ncbi:hypothetical protein RvY_13195 [Ramazzottius varieornatus]|uniref:Uncharacterized protein n=1 Tax=Ramazzottius varieornatus TaxID=947166 RepID=A0A1D1VSF5_RAMVA|nr:hypothetical protein RvY_13195 [Ramazzottius varieornatus]